MKGQMEDPNEVINKGFDEDFGVIAGEVLQYGVNK